MMRADKIPEIEAALEAMRVACEAYSDAVINELPPGTMVMMEWGERMVGPYEVVSVSSAWWSTPGQLYLENPRTGKYRSASPCQVYPEQEGK